jgi:WD40 repeat protein
VPVTADGHAGEIFCCAHSPDGAQVLTAGWDGHLRTWDTATGDMLACVQVGPKPLSCCAFTPDGRGWLAGSMEGMLSVWDANLQTRRGEHLAHTRPISAITYSPGGKYFVTASWDRTLIVRKAASEREGKTLSGHQDIVAGCCFTADARRLLSWSHDGTLRLWDLDFVKEVACLTGHGDRVTAAAVSPDGRWAVSGGRDRLLKLWDLTQGTEAGSWPQNGEVRGCYFLLDGASFAAVDAAGQVFVLGAPELDFRADLQTQVKVMCGSLAPSGLQVALGAEDGRVRFVELEDFEQGSILVTATQSVKERATLFTRLLGRTRTVRMYFFTCPACRYAVEAQTLPPNDFACPSCRRRLRINAQIPQPA